jgi:phospholipase C
MGFYKDFSFETVDDPNIGRIVRFYETSNVSAPVLPPGDSLTLEFKAIAGAIRFSLSALDAANPTDVRPVRPGDDETIDVWNVVPFAFELFDPVNDLVAQQKRDHAAAITDTNLPNGDVSFVHVSPGGTREPQPWRCTLKNTGTAVAKFSLYVGAPIHASPSRELPLATSLLNNAFRVILEALTPYVELTGNRIRWQFGRELLDHFGDSVPQLQPQERPLPDGLSASGHLRTFQVEATSGEALRQAVINYPRDPIIHNQFWVNDWLVKVKPNQPTIRIRVAFTDINWSYDLAPGWDADGVVKQAAVDLFIALNHGLDVGHVLALTSASVEDSTAYEIAKSLQLAPALRPIIETELPRILEPALPNIGRYLGEALARLALRDAMFMGVSAEGADWKVQYVLPPGVQVDRRTEFDGVIEVPAGLGGHAGGGAAVRPGGAVGRVRAARPVFRLDGLGSAEIPVLEEASGDDPWPDEFEVRGRETLARLDQIDTIVVLMMENRSFDHMLGHHTGIPSGVANTVNGRSIPLRQAKDVMVGVPDSEGRIAPVTAIQISPHHDHKNVLEQIAEGAMSGFAADVDDIQQNAGDFVMTYYTDEQLPTYYGLARSFAVCDRWFASHPGGTWPNRWATLTGSALSLTNPPVDHPDLAYIRKATIFNWLEAYGIEWKVFESDLSLVRTFDKHRIDSERVVPLGQRPEGGVGIGEGRTFWDLAARGALPPVVFLEPNFSDIPPLSTANDDLAPADLRRGQRLVAEIVDALMASPQWSRTMFVITYDEHGGFFDHVPPPGTKLGPAEWYDREKNLGKIPLIYPKGSAHLGVRVPALVVSPLVSAGRICSDIFDHTSIIKTILVRHRNRFGRHVFTSFGPRVNQANHLGIALDLNSVRSDRPGPFASAMPAHLSSPTRSPTAAAVSQTEVAQMLRSAFLPKRS